MKTHRDVARVANSNKFNIGEIVLSAVKKLMKNTGWTARTIIKFIKTEYGLIDDKISRKVSRSLKRGVKLGLLQVESGRYRLNVMSRLARPRPMSARKSHGKRKANRVCRIRSRSPSTS